MIRKIIIFLIFVVPFFALVGLTLAKEPRSEKLRILVDKVMQPEEGWVTKEWMVKEVADAGFNVYSPRKGYDKLDEVKQVAAWCRKYGISYLPWMRGTLKAPMSSESVGKRYVPANEKEQPLYSPNSDEFWEWMSHYIIAYAKISVKYNSLMGVFLDFENYVPRVNGYCYGLSYDDGMISKFAKSRKVNISALPFGKRKVWLETHGLHEDFENFQVNYWRERCAILRKTVDQINPEFKFCIYPGPSTLFIKKACYPEWATKKAPVIVADYSTYSKPNAESQYQALQKNHANFVKQIGIVKKLGMPLVIIGGIDPIARPHSDPEFCAKNAVMISEISDGYWVFYEGPNYTNDHSLYFKWFEWANKEIVGGRFDVWYEPEKCLREAFLN